MQRPGVTSTLIGVRDAAQLAGNLVAAEFELSEEQIARIAVNQYRLPGVEVSAQLVRHYPLGASYAHSVGYVGRINEQELKKLDPVNYSGTHHIGKTGVERFYEEQLHGTVGYEEVETNARGALCACSSVPIRWLAKTSI